MSDVAWIGISPDDRSILLAGLEALRLAGRFSGDQAADLARRLSETRDSPNITVGVYGGQVQWTLGNPFPIRVCDYDGDAIDLPDVDERGQRCRMWMEPADQRVLYGDKR